MSQEQHTGLLKRFERIAEMPLLLLSLAFLALLVVIESGAVTAEVSAILDGILWIIWGIFAVELVIKVYLAPDRAQYLRQNWLELLIVAIPFLRPLRILRILIIVARLWRQSRRALRQRLPVFIGMTSLSVVLIASTLMFVAEQGAGGPIATFADAVWWSLTTITTVGYGDTYPVTAFGRGVAVFLMIAGISLFGLLTANIAALFVEEETTQSTQSELADIARRLERIERLLEKIADQSAPEERSQ